MLMGRIAKQWGTTPSDYAGLESGSLEAYLFDTGIALRMSREDRKAEADAKYRGPGGLPGKLGTDHDPDAD